MDIFNSVEEISESIKQWGFDLEYIQATKGTYQGSIATHDFNDTFFMRETVTNQVSVNGRIEDDYYILMLTTDNVSLNGSQACQNELLFLPPGCDLTAATHSNSSTVLQVGIPKPLVENKLKALSDQEIKLDQSTILHHQLTDNLSHYLNVSISSLFTDPETNHTLAEDIQTTLVEQLININDDLCNPSKKSRGRPISDHNLKFKQAVDYIDNNLTNMITLENLCQHTSTSLKNLTRIFAKHSGLTPGRYIMTKKLHAIHYELLNASTHETTVSKVAYKYDINHMGRLASNYYNFFKEQPSQTLTRR